MAKFKFRFDVIQQLRENERDIARAALAEAYEALRQIDVRRQEIAAERRSLDADSAQRRTGTLSVDRLLSDGRFERQLAADDAQAALAAEKIEAELVRRQAVLATTNASVRQMELLKEKDQLAWVEAQLKAEQSNLDEVAGRGNPVQKQLKQAILASTAGEKEERS
jgi:flagellar export protein FliJ